MFNTTTINSLRELQKKNVDLIEALWSDLKKTAEAVNEISYRLEKVEDKIRVLEKDI